MPADAKVLAAHILEEIAFLKLYVASKPLHEFCADGLLWRAATYSVQIISEAV